MVRLVIAIMVASACGKGSEPVAAPAAGSGSAGSNAVPANAGSGSATMVATVALSPKIKAARCGEPCLFLVDTPYANLLDTFKAACGGMETKDLGYDDCKKLDYMRNCIYAAHGLVSKKKKWKLFAAKPWYEAHAEFDAKSISDIERANVHELHARAKACKKGVAISGADYARLQAWFASMSKSPTLPAALAANKELCDAKTFVAEVNKALGGKKVAFDGTVTVDYVDGESPDTEASDELYKAIKPVAGTKRRAIRVVFPTDDTSEGTQIDLIYDDHDALLGASVAHFFDNEGG